MFFYSEVRCLREAIARMIFVVVLAAFAAGSVAAEPFFVGGIQVNEPDHDVWVNNLERYGLNTVSVTVYAHQGNWDSDHLWWDKTNQSVIHEIQTAKQKGLQVVLILRVALDHAFEKNRFLWHGMIMPKTQVQLRSWFAQYRRFVLAWAKKAQQYNVEVLGVASELSALTSTAAVKDIPALATYYLGEVQQQQYKQALIRNSDKIPEKYLASAGGKRFASLEHYLDAQIIAFRNWAKTVTSYGTENKIGAINIRRAVLDAEWRKLISEVRRVFKGKLTYAANFDQYTEVGFWSALDIIGINAYFPLRKETMEQTARARTLYGELLENWKALLQAMVRFRVKEGLGTMPVLFTELGYLYRKDATVAPWAGSGFYLLGEPPVQRLVVAVDQPVDFQERTLALRALREAVSQVEPNLLQGLLYWKLSTKPAHYDIEPFVVVLGDTRDEQMLAALAAFGKGFP